MLKAHKNSLHSVVKEAGYQPEQFETTEGTTDLGDGLGLVDFFAITFKGTPLQFMVLTAPHSFNLFRCVHSLHAPNWPNSQPWPRERYTDLNMIERQLGVWFSEVVGPYEEEQTVPDFWSEAQANGAPFLPSFADPKAGEKFSAQEKALLRLAIADVGEEIKKQLKPTEAELKLINERLEYMNQALDRLNRFDWKNILISTMIGIVTTLTLDTARGALLYRIFKTAFTMSLHLLQ